MSLKYNWRKIFITGEEIPKLIRSLTLKWSPKLIVIDTETTGRNLGIDKPFYISLSFLTSENEAIAVGIDIEDTDIEDVKALLYTVYDLSKQAGLVGHNLPFDLVMNHNLGIDITHENTVDTMSLIRLATDAIQVKYGGAPLGLKAFTHRYITEDATFYSKVLNTARQRIAKELNKEFKSQIPSVKEWERLTAKQFYPDAEDLPEPYKSIYDKWFNELPRAIQENMTEMMVTTDDVPFNLIDRKLLSDYAIYDAIFTYEVYDLLIGQLHQRDQTAIFELEKKLIVPLYQISREGFKINKEYIEEVKPKVKQYLLKRQQDLKDLTGVNMTHSQTSLLLQVLQIKFNLDKLTSTNEESLSLALERLYEDDPESPAIQVIETVTELRSVSKWYSTYLKRFYRTLMSGQEYVYTTLNPSGTVTGRFTSDFQQFPNGILYANDGTELLQPRKLICPPDNYVLLLVDYSQIELRFQALYTILLGQPDVNMCQAYMPYLCTHYLTGEEYDFNKPEHIARWDEEQTDTGISAWLKEDGTPWVKTDLHSKTTLEAYPHLDITSKEFKHLRSERGKRANFACNYGAKAARLKVMFHISMTEANKIYQAYRNTFPGVIKFHQWCYDTINQQGYGENLFGRKYYNTTGHQFSNAAVQGTAADLLKTKIIELYEFLKPYKTKMIMNVHDEIIFKLYPREYFLVPEIIRIMEDLPGTKIPIVAEASVAVANWAEKKGFELENGHAKLLA